MGKVKKSVYYWKCDRCTHEWPPKGNDKPKFCPACKSPYWDTPRKYKTAKQARSRRTERGKAIAG